MRKGLRVKKIIVLGLVLLGVFFIFSSIDAQALNQSFGEQSGLPTANLQVVVARIINAFLGILGLVAVGIILYGGFLYMTARGEAERVQKAKKLLIQATIGLLIIASAFMITTFILYTLGYYGGDDNGNLIPPPCSGCACTGTCPPCVGCDADCTNPAPGSGAPYICNVRPSKQAVGGVLTIYGKDLGTYTAGSSKVFFIKEGDLTNTKIEGTILSCGESGPRRWNIDNDGIIKVEVPAVLTFIADGNNDYKVYVQNADKTSVDNPLDPFKLRNIFTLTNDPPSPEIICLDPNFGAEGFAPVKVIGKFLGSQTDNKLVFNKNVAATAITSWTNDLITATVPAGAIRGNVYITENTPEAKKISDGMNFWVTCSQTASPFDCASNCCRSIDTYLTPVCDLEKYCKSLGIGANCNGNTVAGGACVPEVCDVGVCDATSCICREPIAGDSCSSSTTGCVADQAICGDTMVCDNSCECQTPPVITAVTPNNGAPGNYVTITGKGFGVPILAENGVPTLGQVYFCGADTNSDNNKCGDTGDILAKFPYEENNTCNVADSWGNNQILVIIPTDAINGPIMVKSINGLQDQTDSLPGEEIDDFFVNSTKRPSLCGLTPNQGSFTNLITANGTSFGSSGSVYLGNETDNKKFDGAWTWTDKIITNLAVPNVKSGNIATFVKVGTEDSNPMSFKVINSADLPTIDTIDPVQGPNGQYVTILGSRFGKQPGQVKFYKAGESTTITTNWQPGDIDFPIACANKYWSDTQIIIKVPSDAASGVDIGLAVVTSDELVSNIVKFNHCVSSGTCLLQPGICSIVPNQAPSGSSNVAIYGNNFGTYNGTQSKVVFFNNKEVTGLATSWQDKQITAITVPTGAVSGPVIIRDGQGTSSNKINFKVADCRTDAGICTSDTGPCCVQDGSCKPATECQSSTGTDCEYKYTFKTGLRVIELGLPEVVESYACDGDINQSPSPWKDPSNAGDYACVNAQIYARFNQDMEISTLKDSNMIVRSCTPDKSVCDGVITSSLITTEENSIAFTPSSNLTEATWYKVILSGSGIKSATNKFLDGDKDGIEGGNYEWYFRTRDSGEICQIETVNVTPNVKDLNLLTQTQVYTARARAANCNILAGIFNWTWYKKSSLAGNRESRAGGVATLSDYSDSLGVLINGKQLATPLIQGIVYIGAEVENKFDENNKLTVDLKIPEIKDFFHKDGVINEQVNSYVTVSGINFGASQGGSKLYFENSTGLNGGWTEAKLANCDQAWTNTHVNVIVPKDVKRKTAGGAWIKIVTAFGEDTTNFNNDANRDLGEVFLDGLNLYPFICQLNPNVGKEGVSVTAVGDNFGDKYKTNYNGQEYGVGSYVNFEDLMTPVLTTNKITAWNNTSVRYVNPLGDLSSPEVDVFVSIDPYSEPYQDKNNDGIYSCSALNPAPGCLDIYADTNNNGQYNKTNYTVDGSIKTSLESNRVTFYQPAVITSISPDNGPVRQWITIYGKNFGTYDAATSKIYFRNATVNDGAGDPQPGDTLASLVPCETDTWFDNYIIAEVPASLAESKYFVYLITSSGLVSNKDKTFTVNDKPLGAGLCSLSKYQGNTGDPIAAHGVRFGASKGENNLVFSDKKNADTVSWSDSDITGYVPTTVQTGAVFINKKVDIGQRCTSFEINGWCVNNTYETVYQEVPSNSLPFEVITIDCTKPVLSSAARDLGFPIATYIRRSDGTKQSFTNLNLANIASDGKFLYGMPRSGYTSIYDSVNDTLLTIYKIGTGYGGTELGKLYNTYQFTGNYYLPITETIYSTVFRQIPEPFTAENSLIATPDGLYVSHLFNFKNRSGWLPSSMISTAVYYKEFWGIPKIIFNETNNTYDWQVREVPQSVGPVLYSTGSNILDVSIVGGGYTINVLDNSFKKVSEKVIKNAEVKLGDTYNNTYAFKAISYNGVADSKYLYFDTNGNGYINVIDWNNASWAGVYKNYTNVTKEYRGAYDWVNDKFWYGQSWWGSGVVNEPHNLIYRYSNCPVPDAGYCLTDEACIIGTRCTNSKCVNNQCTPEIKSMLPTSGPVGKWVDITGCYLGCQPGQVYFSKGVTQNSFPQNGLLVAYLFNDEANPWADSSVNNRTATLMSTSSKATGNSKKTVVNGKLISTAVLNQAGDVVRGPAAINDLTQYGASNRKMTISARIKPGTLDKNGSAFVGYVPAFSSIKISSTGYLNLDMVGIAPVILIPGVTSRTVNLNFIPAQWNDVTIVAEEKIGFKVYVNGRLINQTALDLIFSSWPNGPSITSITSSPDYVGEIDNILIYNRILSAQEIFNLYRVKANAPASSQGECENPWACSSNLTASYDQVKVEVPNIKTLTNTADDGISGPMVLKTSKDLYADVGNFDVTNAAVGTQVCETTTSLCSNGTIDSGEECDGTNLGTATDCESIDMGAGSLSCTSSCQYDVTDCEAYKLCGNGDINGKCSNGDTSLSMAVCLATPKYIWNSTNSTCSNPRFVTQADCLRELSTWIGEQCDCSNPWSCSGLPTCSSLGRGAGNVGCYAPISASGSKLCKFDYTDCDNSAVCGDGLIGAEEDCDFNGSVPDLQDETCDSLGYGTGILGCYAAGTKNDTNQNIGCKYNLLGCSKDTTPPFVEKTSPPNDVADFCRNGIVDIYFNELLDPKTITKANFIFGSCDTSALIVKNDGGLLNKIVDYAKNIFFKLIGYKTKAVAAVDTVCTMNPFNTNDYSVSYTNIRNTWNSTTDKCSDPAITAKDDCHPKTVVYLELTGTKLFAPATTFHVGVKNGIKDLAGNGLNYAKNSYLNLIINDVPQPAYGFKFKTAGICDADQLKIYVYHESVQASDLYVDYESTPELNKYDLFRCAGANNCALPAVITNGLETVPADYDQDNKTAGNQHIYSAKAFYTGSGQNYHLSMTYRWVRSSASDPANMLQLNNAIEDTDADQNVVRNSSGVAYVTALPQKDKENTSLLIVDAQARASASDPVYKIFKVKYFDCAWPWYFEEDYYGNSYSWYCRDKEPLLPDAGKIKINIP